MAFCDSPKEVESWLLREGFVLLGRRFLGWVLPESVSPLVITFPIYRGDIFSAVLADISDMTRSSLPANTRRSPSRFISSYARQTRQVFKRMSSQIFQGHAGSCLTRPPVTFDKMKRHEGLHTLAAHEETGVGVRMSPLLVDVFLGRVPPPLPSSRSLMRGRSAW